MDDLKDYDDEQGEAEDGQMDEAERQESIRWRKTEIDTRIRRKDNTINKGD